MKRFLKITLISLLSLGVVVVVIAVAIFIKLPSVAAIGQAIAKKTKANTTAPISPAVSTAALPVSGDSTVPGFEDEEDPVRLAAEKEAIRKDLMDPSAPVSNVCAYLGGARAKSYKESDDIDQVFNDSFFADTKDPRIQAMKPFLRYMLQLPKLSQLIRETDSATENGDESFVDKAGFYAKLYTALGELQEHKTDLEALMDRGYFYLGLNNLIVFKPELKNDSRLLNYCMGVEVAFNQKRAVSLEEERAEFLNLLNDVDVQPSDIHFDPTYKSVVSFELNPASVGLQGRSWLSEVFQSEDQDDDPVAR